MIKIINSGVFPKWKGNSVNWGQFFKNNLSYLCPTGSVVTSWSLTQDVLGSNNLCHKKLSLDFASSVKIFRVYPHRVAAAESASAAVAAANASQW